MALAAGPSSHSCLIAGNREAHRNGLQGYPWVLVHAELPHFTPALPSTLDTVLDTCASQQHHGILLTSPCVLHATTRNLVDNVSRGIQPSHCDFPLVSVGNL